MIQELPSLGLLIVHLIQNSLYLKICHPLCPELSVLNIFSGGNSADGEILGECVATQTSARYGGVIPSFAMGFHADALPKIVNDVIKQSRKGDQSEKIDLGKLKEYGVEMVAVTNQPGMAGSLDTGLSFAKFLCQKNQIPMIPVHHMEAHALTPRMTHKVRNFFHSKLADSR